MAGDRKTPYKFDKRIGPDIPALVAKHPERCRVHLDDGKWYKFMYCSNPTCPRRKEGYWRRYAGVGKPGGALTSTNPKQTYCCDACAKESATRLRAARQKLWRENNPEASAAIQAAAGRRYRLKLKRAGRRSRA